jgi:glyoxylase-like metal-dependent hydrolase (beta-lactamase superfamily II)
MRKLTTDVYMLEHVGSASAFLLTASIGATLIDTGMPGKFKALLAEIEATQQPLNAIQQIVLTHCHADHTGNVAELVKRTQAKLIAHQDEVPYILQQQALPASSALKKVMLGLMDIVFKTHVERVDTTVTDGDTIDALGGLQVIHVPGHTPGSIALYQPERRIMFFGDIIFNERGLKVAPKIFNVDTAKVTKAAHKLAAYDIDIACFGHGEPYTENAGERIRQFLQGGL